MLHSYSSGANLPAAKCGERIFRGRIFRIPFTVKCSAMRNDKRGPLTLSRLFILAPHRPSTGWYVTNSCCCSIYSLSTLYDNKDHWRLPPPSSRLGTGTVRVRTVAELLPKRNEIGLGNEWCDWLYFLIEDAWHIDQRCRPTHGRRLDRALGL